MVICFILDHIADAIDYLDKKRGGIGPALYNKRRAYEQPVPNVNPPPLVDEANQFEAEYINGSQNDTQDKSQDESGGENQSESENESVSTNAPEPMAEVLLDIQHNIKDENIARLTADDEALFTNIITDNDTDDDDEPIFEEIAADVFPKPIKCVEQSLIKRDDDCLSGNRPYNDTVSENHFEYCTLIIQ